MISWKSCYVVCHIDICVYATTNVTWFSDLLLNIWLYDIIRFYNDSFIFIRVNGMSRILLLFTVWPFHRGAIPSFKIGKGLLI